MNPVVATLAVDSRCTHGEGVIWCERRQALFWIDISEKRLWRHDPGPALTRQWTLPDRPGCLGLIEDGRLLVVLAKSVCVADPDAPAGALPLQHLAEVEPGNPHTRSNDGRADRHGNFVFGTMDEHDEKAERGAFYQFSLRHGLRRLPLGGVSIPNSICFSPDGLTLYYCDSVRPQILCCDYDPDNARTANPRVFTTLDRPDAEPDGSIVDREGFLWNAQWRAWRVVRYRPDGEVDRVVAMPVKHPTCSAFGGAGLDRLYVISSRLDHHEDELADTPDAGSLYQCTPGVAGLPESRIAAA
ncbi:MAG: SMP-30/gluconolactonase/LRE family protein [Pseudomonas sp.]